MYKTKAAYVLLGLSRDMTGAAAAATDVVLSDVHCEVVTTKHQNVATSRFPFRPPFQCCSKSVPNHDNDGDVIVERRQQYLFVIEHAMATPLDDVGQQVWHGALLLGDLMLNMNEQITGTTILELGGGVGLSSLAAALYANTVICTDTGDKVLELCSKNIQYNIESLGRDVVPASVLVKSLDWLHPSPAKDNCEHKWSYQDLTTLSLTDYVIAADVVYDDVITDAFFSCLTHLYTEVFTRRPPLYIALEKRINFTVEHFAPVSPAHQYFMQQLVRDHVSQSGDRLRYTANQMAVNNITQCFQYNRTDQMELWQLEIVTISDKGTR